MIKFIKFFAWFLFVFVIFVILVNLMNAQTLPSGWVPVIGDVLAWNQGSLTAFEYQQLDSTAGSLIAAQTSNFHGKQQMEKQVVTAIHMLCNRDLKYCETVFQDLRLMFKQPLPFGGNPPVTNPTPTVLPPPTVLPFGGQTK